MARLIVPSPVDARKPGVRMISIRFAHRRFLVGFRVGHASIDSLHNLGLGETGVFQLVVGCDFNPRIGFGHKAYVDFLLFNRVTGTERDRT